MEISNKEIAMSFKNYGKQFVKAAKQGRDFTQYKGAAPTKGTVRRQGL